MTGPVPLGRLVVEERVLPVQGGAPVTVVPSGDGSSLVMTTGGAVAVMDLGEAEPEWRAVPAPAGLLADASGAERPEAFAWGPVRGAGRAFGGAPPPRPLRRGAGHGSGPGRLEGARRRGAIAWRCGAGTGRGIGLYRLRGQGGSPHLEVVVPPFRAMRRSLPRGGVCGHRAARPRAGRWSTCSAGPGRRCTRFGWRAAAVRCRWGDPSPALRAGWLRAVAPPRRSDLGRGPRLSVSWLDPARGLLAGHPSWPPLLNRPMVSFLARARPSSLKAVAVALAAAGRSWQVPLPIGDEDDGRERLAALVPRRGGELWVVTSRRAMRLDLPRLRRLVREVPWADLGQVLEPGDLTDYVRRRGALAEPGPGGRWFGEILSVCGEGQLPGRGRGRGAPQGPRRRGTLAAAVLQCAPDRAGDRPAAPLRWRWSCPTIPSTRRGLAAVGRGRAGPSGAAGGGAGGSAGCVGTPRCSRGG